MTWTLKIGTVHLMNKSGSPVAGGSPCLWHTTPFALQTGWAPKVAQPQVVYSGESPMSLGARPLYSTYRNVVDTLPVNVVGTDSANLAWALQQLKAELSGASYSRPLVWSHKPAGASFEVFAEIYAGTVQEKTNTAIGPIEGGADIEIEIEIVRSPFFGADELITLISAQTFTNTHTGDALTLGELFGDMVAEGQPLNIRVDKPATGAAASLILATIHSRTGSSINGAVTTTSTTGANYTATGSIDVSALRARAALELRILARFKTLTSPSSALVRATVKTAAGNTLWIGSWVPLSTDTTAQLVDLGGAPLDMLRVPMGSAAANITITVSICTPSGASVTATLDYVESLLAYDVCIIESAGLASGQHHECFGAQNVSGGGWLPQIPEVAGCFDGSSVQTNFARIRGQLPRAFRGASLFVAWYDSGRSHVITDTAAVTVKMAPLWRSLRGVS